MIKGADEPNAVSPSFCNIGDVIEINVQASAMVAEGLNISILEDDKVVAVAKADDMEEPSSLSVLYTGNATAFYSVQITSSNDAVIPAKALQIAVK